MTALPWEEYTAVCPCGRDATWTGRLVPDCVGHNTVLRVTVDCGGC